MIIDQSEKNRILKLYGLINENNIIYEEVDLKTTEFSYSGSDPSWVITYKANDNNYYPISDLKGLDAKSQRVVDKYKIVYTKKRKVEEGLDNLEDELRITGKKPSGETSKNSVLSSDFGVADKALKKDVLSSDFGGADKFGLA